MIAVLLYHADLPFLRGGFLGVEVFFVISGYLITLLLVAEHDATGTISLGRFWLRRARRLLPALFGLLIATAAAVWRFEPQSLADLRAQLLAALAYCTNWYLIAANQSYFGTGDRPPLLQHLWSLAVEEQFYILWPLLLLGVIRLLRARRALLSLVIGAGAVASTLRMAALYDPALDPSRAYYGTDARASGLLLGALLALHWRPGSTALPAGRRQRLLLDGAGALGGLGLLAAFQLLLETDPHLFRGGFAVVGLLSVACIVCATHPLARTVQAVLSHPVLTWIGVRSYGLYLWHYPIFAVTRPGVELLASPWQVLVLRLALTGMAAGLSYRFLEEPVRRGAIGRWVRALGGPPSPRRDVRRWLTAGASLAATAALFALGRPVALAVKPLDDVERSIRLGQDAAPRTRSSSDPGPAAVSTAARPAPSASRPTPPEIARARSVTVLSDSVLLGVRKALEQELGEDGWRVDYRGCPAMMVHQSNRELSAANVPVAPLVIVGLGHNSLWERDRRNIERWSKRFDRDADQLLGTLSRLGARRVVWVALQEPTLETIPRKSLAQFRKYAWYFPYANDRIRALPERHPEVVVANWTGVSQKPGITFDAIHLNPVGVRMMIDTLREAAGI